MLGMPRPTPVGAQGGQNAQAHCRLATARQPASTFCLKRSLPPPPSHLKLSGPARCGLEFAASRPTPVGAQGGQNAQAHCRLATGPPAAAILHVAWF
jgi:hypothetical protein